MALTTRKPSIHFGANTGIYGHGRSKYLGTKGTEVATIAPEASIKRAVEWLRAKNVGALVVTSNDAILGIISERDIARALSQYDAPVASMLAPNQRKWLCCNSFQRFAEAPRCRQSVAQICSD
ncbi:MAG: CBS domain-containing protein, partial [Rhizomicrobium sp.]